MDRVLGWLQCTVPVTIIRGCSHPLHRWRYTSDTVVVLDQYSYNNYSQRHHKLFTFLMDFFLVEEPCELGCDGLSYCSNFNNRPTELFRSCNRRADDAARNDVALWLQQGTLGLPGLSLPVLNISQCSPRAWKTVACTLQIKPCHRPSNVNWICR